MPPEAPHVVRLTEVGRGDVALAGGKGANLGELLRAGFAVPPGFVVTTQLYRDVLAAPSPTRLPEDLAAEVLAAYDELGGGPVAVRSSATAEDLPGAAFAGQQETFLDVEGAEALLAAVRGCWASLWSDRAVAYRRHIGYDADPAMAVVVQRMVPAEYAGVLFTADPVTGARDRVVVEATRGLGEAVVSGQVTPLHLVVDAAGRTRERSGADDVDLPPELPAELARVGRAISRHFGCPQDVEWAHAGGRTWIVQARPLTALPPAPIRLNRVRRLMGTITAELVPERPYPLDVTAWTVPGWFTILARMAAEVVAVRVDVSQLLIQTDHVVTELRPLRPRPTWRTLTTPVRLRHQVARHDPARWTADPRFAAYEQGLERLRGRDLGTLDWPALLALPDEALALLGEVVSLRIDHLPGAAVAVGRLAVLLRVLGLPQELWPLLAGQRTQTRAANDALHAIAADVSASPAWAAAFATLDDAALVAAVRDDPGFAALRDTLRSWLDRYGHRETTSAALLSGPSWEHDPELLLGSIRGLVTHPVTGPAAGPEQEGEALRRTLARRRVRLTRTGALITRSAAAAREALTFREDSHFHALRVRPVVLDALLEAGARLERAGVLLRARDVFHLELAELQALGEPAELTAENRRRLRETVAERSRRRAELGSAPLISPATLHPGRRRPRRDALVTGAPGGGGRATGPVRVVTGPHEFERLRPGDVLVCPYTNPAWTPLFQVATAVVADAGSAASHAAIIAREYGIPSVMGTGNGTRVLTDGVVVTVDGTRGEVVGGPVDHVRRPTP